jgi:hypothetical protein
MIATSNFVNITGAIAASVLFFLVVFAAQRTGLAPAVADRQPLGEGELTALTLSRGRPVHFELRRDDGTVVAGGQPPATTGPLTPRQVARRVFAAHGASEVLEVARGVGEGQRVSVSRYAVGGVAHYDLVPAGAAPAADFDQRRLPRLLFVGAAVMTGLMLLVILGPLRRLRREEATSEER